MACYAYLCMVCSDIDMCNADVYTIFDYPFVQNTNVNDQTILLNLCYLLKYFEMTMMWYALHTNMWYAMHVTHVLILCMYPFLE